jgi:hypothetical protein
LPWACAGSGTRVLSRSGPMTSPQIARYAFDQGQAAFANGRVALGCFAGCCGWVIVSTRFLPRWLGWLAIASGAGLVISRIAWTNMVWLVPYLMLWLWMIIIAAILLRRGVRVAEPGAIDSAA